jgi:hypothetical protein
MKVIPSTTHSRQARWIFVVMVFACLFACEHPSKHPSNQPQAPAVQVNYYQRFDFISWKGDGAAPARGPGVWEVGTQADTIKYVHLHLDRKEPEHLVFERRKGKIRFHLEGASRQDFDAWMQPYASDSVLIFFQDCGRREIEYLILDFDLQPRQHLWLEHIESSDSAKLFTAADFVEVDDTVKMRPKVIPAKLTRRFWMPDTGNLDSIMQLARRVKKFPDSEIVGLPEAVRPSDPIILHSHCLDMKDYVMGYFMFRR